MLSSWKKVKKGDKRAFEHIYYEVFDRLANYGLRLVDDREMVNDAIQNVFLQIWKKRNEIRVNQSIENYLYTCLRRQIMSELKGKNNDHLAAHEYTSLQMSEPEPSVNSDQIIKVQHVIDQLPKRQKEIIYLKYKENMTYDEIVAIMGISKNSLYKLMNKAIASLKRSV